MDADSQAVIGRVDLLAARKRAARYLSMNRFERPSELLLDVSATYFAGLDKGLAAPQALEVACGLHSREDSSSAAGSASSLDELLSLAKRNPEQESVLVAGVWSFLSESQERFSPVRVDGTMYVRSQPVEYPLLIGCDDQRAEIEHSVEQLFFYDRSSLSNSQRDAQFKGILLTGPPGTGKTSLCRHAIAHARRRSSETNVPFRYSQFRSDDYSMWLGESSKAMARKFSRAANPSGVGMLIIDDADIVLPSRDDSSAGFGSLQVTGQFMQHLSGVQESSHGNLLVLATTNCPEKIDPASLRRFGLRLEVPIYSEKEYFSEFLVERMPWASSSVRDYLADVGFQRRLSPAYLDHLVRRMDRFRRGRPDPSLFALPLDERVEQYSASFRELSVSDASALVAEYTIA